MKKLQISTRSIAFTSLMTAIVFISTSFISIRFGDGYTNLGDAFIFLTAAFFGPIPALIAGGLGSFLADFYAYPVTMWFTLIIKSMEGLISGLFVFFANNVFKGNEKKEVIKKYVIYIFGFIFSALFMVLGYYISKAFMYGTMETALISLPRNFLQGGVSIIVAIILYVALYPSLGRYLFKDKYEKIKREKLEDE